MRYIFLSISLASLLNASYLLDQSSSNHFCIENYYFQNNNLVYLKSIDQNWYSSSSYYLITNGFDYNASSNKCDLIPILKDSGLTYDNYNYLMALLGLLTGFIFLFMASYLVIEIAYKRR